MAELNLLQLPPEAQKNVLRTMDYGQLIGHSLCSKSTKRQVIALKYNNKNMNLAVTHWDENIKIIINCERGNELFRAIFARRHCIDLFVPSRIQFRMPVPVGGYRKEDFEISNWIAHLATIFHIKTIGSVRIPGFVRGIQNIREIIGSMKFNTLHIMFNDRWYTEIMLKELVPKNKIIKWGGPFKCGSKVLVQNLKVLHVIDCQSWKLNDLLMMNASYAYLHNATINSTDLNRFLKLWMRGSNPRLVYFECTMEGRNLDRDEVRRGLQGLKIPFRTIRTFDKHSLDSTVQRHEVRGGFDIRRYDGTLATVFFQVANMSQFVVWQ